MKSQSCGEDVEEKVVSSTLLIVGDEIMQSKAVAPRSLISAISRKWIRPVNLRNVNRNEGKDVNICCGGETEVLDATAARARRGRARITMDDNREITIVRLCAIFSRIGRFGGNRNRPKSDMVQFLSPCRQNCANNLKARSNNQNAQGGAGHT